MTELVGALVNVLHAAARALDAIAMHYELEAAEHTARIAALSRFAQGLPPVAPLDGPDRG